MISIDQCKHLLVDSRELNKFYCWITAPCEHLQKNEVDCPLITHMRDYTNGTYKSHNPEKQKMIEKLLAVPKKGD